MFYPHDFSFILLYGDLVQYLSPEIWHSLLHWLSFHRDLYILFIRLNPTQSQWTCCWFKDSGFAPVTGQWWLFVPSVPVFKCWCSCRGDENNSSTGADNAEIASRPRRVSPVEMVLKTVQVCLYSLWNHCQQMGPGWASGDESWDELGRLWLCVNARGILLLRYAVQHHFQCCLVGRLLQTVFTNSLRGCLFQNTLSYSKLPDIISCWLFLF